MNPDTASGRRAKTALDDVPHPRPPHRRPITGHRQLKLLWAPKAARITSAKCETMQTRPIGVKHLPMRGLQDQLLQMTKLRYEAMPLLMAAMHVDESLAIGDIVSLILKVHLLSEMAIDKLLQVALAPNGDAVLAADLRYDAKLTIASRCQLVDGLPLLEDFVVGSLRRLNRLRNRLAHELGATVTRDEAVGLFMGIDHPMPDPETADVALLVYHYTAFIFGNLLPKYEVMEGGG